MPSVRIALAQINSTVGDLDGSYQKILSFARRADECGAEIVIFPELCLCGYPPEDLLRGARLPGCAVAPAAVAMETKCSRVLRSAARCCAGTLFDDL